jgi:hypothetical protein
MAPGKKLTRVCQVVVRVKRQAVKLRLKLPSLAKFKLFGLNT